MKTVGDLERWLKGAGKESSMQLRMDGERFYVSINGFASKSKVSLESALENALEELRRRENGAESMRSEKQGALTKANLLATMAAVKAATPHWSVSVGYCSTHGTYTYGNAVATCPYCPPVPKVSP